MRLPAGCNFIHGLFFAPDDSKVWKEGSRVETEDTFHLLLMRKKVTVDIGLSDFHITEDNWEIWVLIDMNTTCVLHSCACMGMLGLWC